MQKTLTMMKKVINLTESEKNYVHSEHSVNKKRVIKASRAVIMVIKFSVLQVHFAMILLSFLLFIVLLIQVFRFRLFRIILL